MDPKYQSELTQKLLKTCDYK